MGREKGRGEREGARKGREGEGEEGEKWRGGGRGERGDRGRGEGEGEGGRVLLFKIHPYSLHISELHADTYSGTPWLPTNSPSVLHVLPSDCRMYPELHSHRKEPAWFTHL